MRSKKTVLWVMVAILALPCLGQYDDDEYSFSRPDSIEGLFTLKTDVDPCQAAYIKQYLSAFIDVVQQKYLPKDFKSPLNIYQSPTPDQMNQQITANFDDTRTQLGFYVPSEPTVYTYLVKCHFEPDNFRYDLLPKVVHHMILANDPDAPLWFTEGLSWWLGAQSQLHDDTLLFKNPIPCENTVLKEKIDSGSRPNIKLLFSAAQNEETFERMDYAKHFSRELIYWLSVNNALESFIKLSLNDGCTLENLEKATGRSWSQINIEMLDFIKRNCPAEAALYKALQTDDLQTKQAYLQTALQYRPHYDLALLETARIALQKRDFEKCLKILEPVLHNPSSGYQRRASVMAAQAMYYSNNYQKALPMYQQAWEYAEHFEYQYRIAYKIANCYFHLEDFENAAQWYKTYLDCKWNEQEMQSCDQYAKKFVELQQPSGYDRNAVSDY